MIKKHDCIRLQTKELGELVVGVVVTVFERKKRKKIGRKEKKKEISFTFSLFSFGL